MGVFCAGGVKQYPTVSEAPDTPTSHVTYLQKAEKITYALIQASCLCQDLKVSLNYMQN